MGAAVEELAVSVSASGGPVRPCPAELVAAWSIGGRRAGSSTPVVAFAQLASVAESADAPALGAGVFGREGSSPSARTTFQPIYQRVTQRHHSWAGVGPHTVPSRPT